MIFDLLAPYQGPRGRGQKKCVVARPIHVSNTHTKFGWISSNGLGEDSVTDGRTDGQTDGRTDGGDCNIPNAFLKKRGDKYRLMQVKSIAECSKGEHSAILSTCIKLYQLQLILLFCLFLSCRFTQVLLYFKKV